MISPELSVTTARFALTLGGIFPDTFYGVQVCEKSVKVESFSNPGPFDRFLSTVL